MSELTRLDLCRIFEHKSVAHAIIVQTHFTIANVV